MPIHEAIGLGCKVAARMRRLLFGLAPPALLLAQSLWNVDRLHARGLSGLAVTLFDLVTAAVVLTIGLGFGLQLLSRMRIWRSLSQIERWLVGFSFGMGALGIAVMLLGFLQLMVPAAIAVVVGCAGAVGVGKPAGPSGLSLLEFPTRLKASSIWERGLGVVLLVLLAAALITALGPPMGYDALMYHLVGARAFLNHHGFFPSTENWWINYPFLVQMLFVIGLAFRTDVVARLVNLSFGVCLVVLTYVLVRRMGRVKESWLSVAPLAAVPPLALWASAAYIDLANAVFVGLAALCLLIWRSERAGSTLALSGIFAGLAIGSKYTAVLDVLILSVGLVWLTRKRSLVDSTRTLGVFLLTTLLVGGAWYMRNWLWLGSPIFPSTFIGQSPGSIRQLLNIAYVLDGFGPGRTLAGYLSLPLELYRNSLSFGQFALEMPSLLFPIVVFAPIVWSKISKPLILITGVRIALWAATTQQMRFLLTTFLPLALLTGEVLQGLIQSAPRLRTLVVRSLTAAVALSAAIAGVARLEQIQPVAALIGLESREQYLVRELNGYPARRYIAEQLETQDSVYLIGDGRRYYCPAQCDPIVDQFGWTGLAIEAGYQPQAIVARLCERGNSHLLLSWLDINYLLFHDPDGSVRQSIETLLGPAMQSMLTLVFEEPEASLYALSC